MDALGVSCEMRYAGGATRIANTSWKPNRLHFILKNPVYDGRHTVKSQNGPIATQVPALVTREIRDADTGRAGAEPQALDSKREEPLPAARADLLKVRARLHRAYSVTRKGVVKWEYRCSGQFISATAIPGERCRAKILPADMVEERVWQDCRRFIEDPGQTLQDAESELRKRSGDTVNTDIEWRRLTRLLAEKEAERERVMTLFRRGRQALEDVEQQLDAIQGEATEIRGQLNVPPGSAGRRGGG